MACKSLTRLIFPHSLVRHDLMRCITIRTPAWDLCIVSFETEGSWADHAYHVEPNGPATIDLICSQEPYTPILAHSSLVGGNSFLGNDVEPMSLLPLLRYSQATAEGM